MEESLQGYKDPENRINIDKVRQLAAKWMET